MITLHAVYLLAGALFAAYAILSATARRARNAALWALMSVSFLLGDRLGDKGNGLLVLVLVSVATLGMPRPAPAAEPEFRAAEAKRRGNRLFAAALIIPATALIGTLTFKQMPALIDAKQATLIALALGVLIAATVACLWLRATPIMAVREGLRLMDTVGVIVVLPQMLASLGAVFALAGVGTLVGGFIENIIPASSLLGAVLAFALGMALFTILMGNAFAAFPVMAAAVAVPVLIGRFHGDPAAVAALGMLCGFCGTLLTPMAANFNILPAVLLELKDRNAVIRAQAPTALALFVINVLLLWWLAFR